MTPTGVHIRPVVRGPGHLAVAVDIDGSHRDWWLTSTTPHLSVLMDPFLAGALLPAMATGGPLVIDGPVSDALLDQVPAIQSVFRIWRRDPYRPNGPILRPVEVTATGRDVAEVGAGRALLFSGGVNSFESLLRLGDQIDALIHVEDEGVDDLSAPHTAPQPEDATAAAARAFGKEMVRVRSNGRAVFSGQVSGAAYTSPLLACIALAHAPAFGTIHLSTTLDVRRLGPNATNPVLDPRYSAGGQRITPGPIDSTWFGKLRAVAQSPVALAVLHVCPSTSGNCGTCSRCVLTLLGLQAIGAIASAMPRDHVDPSEIPPAMWGDPRAVPDFTDIATWLADRGRLPDHVAAVDRGMAPPPRTVTRGEAMRALASAMRPRRREVSTP